MRQWPVYEQAGDRLGVDDVDVASADVVEGVDDEVLQGFKFHQVSLVAPAGAAGLKR